jgi:glycerophosphoryl diester phosphodiesterase
VSGVSELRRVGHKGADLIAPGNTPASFDAALQAGVDMIEFDVLPEDWRAPETSRLVLAHDYEHGIAGAPTLEEGLDHLASAPFAGLDLDVDLKLPGYEERVVRALQERELVQRALVSSQYMRSLVAIRALEPRLRLGWSVPRVRKDYSRSKLWALPAWGLLAWWRRRLPGIAAEHLHAGRIDAVMSHFRLVTPRLVQAVNAAGGELYVWTVDDPAHIRRLAGMGVTGVISNDPRLFASAA